MPDPVVDLLWNFPGLPAWQTDADGADTNGPQDTDLIKATSPTGLAGELRRVKDQTRLFSLDPAWINYGGWLGAPSQVPPSFDGTVNPVGSGITLTGDWVAPGIAIAGRRIRVTFTSPTAPRRVATIVTATAGGGTTRLVITPPVANAGLHYIEFSALGSGQRTGSGTPAAPDGLNAFPLDLVPASPTDPTLVVPVNQGGTGRATAQTFDPVSDVTGDLAIEPLNLTVQGLQGNHVNASTPNQIDLDQVFWWANPAGGWQPALLSQLVQIPAVQAAIQTFLNFSVVVGVSGGTITIPIAGDPWFIKWAFAQSAFGTGVGNEIIIPWDSPFNSQVLALVAIANDSRLVCAWPAPSFTTVTQAVVAVNNLDPNLVTATVTVIAIGH